MLSEHVQSGALTTRTHNTEARALLSHIIPSYVTEKPRFRMLRHPPAWPLVSHYLPPEKF